MFPEIKYIFWIRDPRDCIIGAHVTDDLRDFGIPYRQARTTSACAARSLEVPVRPGQGHAPPPKLGSRCASRTSCCNQDETLPRLEEFLGIPLARIPVRPDAVGRWKTDEERQLLRLLRDRPCAEYGYELP